MDRQTVAIEVKKALSETVLLSDGQHGFVITEFNESGQDKWECHVCSRIIATERAMLMHLSHPLHMSKMRASHHPAENFRKKQSKDDKSQKKTSETGKTKKEEKSWDMSDTIRPGEPVPPGMEDVVKKVCQIQETLDKHTGPLIGIEYIVELVTTEEESEPKYICLLCEKKGDPRSVMVHLNSHNHALRYISCFFRTAGNAINMIPKIRENRKGVAIAVHKIARGIQKHFGRLKPTLAAAETFSQQKYEILRSIDEKEHFRETPNTTFIEYCTPEKIKEYSKIAENEFNALKNRSVDESDVNTSNEKSENENLKNPHHTATDVKGAESRNTDTPSKLSFSIGKPERSFGRNKSGESNSTSGKKEDDEVIFVTSSNDPIEIHSMSSISSVSDSESKDTKYRRMRSRSRSRGRIRGRQSPIRRRSPPRRRSPFYRDSRYRSRTRSRSRSRGRYYREKERYSRSARDIDRIYGRDKRSRSRDRYEGRGRIERDRYRRSASIERDRRRMSPRSLKDHSPFSKTKSLKSPEPKRKRVVSEYQVKMDAYRTKLHELEVEMDNKLKYYRERPEKHPLYSDEWKNFWNRRYKELQQAGKDPTGYDFKPEWIIFWDERVKKLHEEELDTKKEELKIMLPTEEKGPSNDLQDVSPPTPESSKDVTVDDIKNTWKALTGSEIKAPAKSRSPFSDSRSPVSRRSPSPWEERSKSGRKPPPTYTADPPIVHCLRMLSVLEAQLGSLGPKALDLLSKAILMEKIKHNDSMTLLHEPEIYIFFETVKEKIRGQLIAGIVVRHLVNSCRSLISAIESMLAANPLKAKPLPIIQSKLTYSPIQPEPVKVPGVGLVNKMAVAQQIAEILVAQGRTDVSQQELEELINAVVGMASTSNVNINQPPASFISQLNIQKSTASSHINELLNNLISSAQQSIAAPLIATTNVDQVGPVTPTSLPEIPKPVLETSIINTQASVSLTNTNSPTKAFTEAVTAAKATISEQASIISVAASGVKEKPLFPVDSLSIPKETDKADNKVSDEELKERLMKFKSLSRDDQQSLIALLKELESKEPERVEKLRKYVTLSLSQSASPSIPLKAEADSGRLSPFSSRAGGTNPAPEEKRKPLVMDSDHEEDDDDYSVEDVYKSVSEKLQINKKENERKSDFRINPDELFDDNSTSSHQSYNNPSKPLSPSYQVKSSNSDLRPPYSAVQRPKNDYSVYSVSETPISKPPNDGYNSHPDRFQHPGSQSSDNSYKSAQWTDKTWEGGNERANQQWTGNKTWSQGTQEVVYPPAGRPNLYPSNAYEGGGYSQSMPQYKSAQPPYYGGEPFPPPGPNPQYNNPQYQAGPPTYDNNQGGLSNYSYPKPQGQGYYSNYRQY